MKGYTAIIDMLREKASYGNKVDSDLTHCFTNQ